MSQQNIYPIHLLNDLHNYFPDVLYNPARFRNIQDLLDYIRHVADVNPYSRGLNIYNSHQNIVAQPTATATPTENTIPTTRIRVPLATLNANNTNVLMNTVLGTIFGDIFGPTTGTGTGTVDLHAFLNQRVDIHPTNEEIDNASTLYRANVRHDDICAICQDIIEANQEVRKINHCNHYFHSECIDTWFQSNVLCPTCRHDIRESNQPPPVQENHRRTNINSND